jgi:hypothetical protein
MEKAKIGRRKDFHSAKPRRGDGGSTNQAINKETTKNKNTNKYATIYTNIPKTVIMLI